MPKVSVLLPNLNNRPFLEERIQTVLNQTLTDWELIIVDSYSDDGAWELFQEFAKRDCRIRISQAPREGVYAGLNNCISLAGGEYVYIATSDDTMALDCLEKMVNALDAHPECDIAHCCLTKIDAEGREILESAWIDTQKATFFGDYINQEHIRLAPHDGLLYCGIGTLYTSLTQLLIRREVFDKIGFFKTAFGSPGDFEWGLRASLVYNTIHIPEYLATWRIHSKQATQQVFAHSYEAKRLKCKMVESAIESLKQRNYNIAIKLNIKTLTFCSRFQQLRVGVKEQKTISGKANFLLKFILVNFDVVSVYVIFRLTNRRFSNICFIKKVLKKLGCSNNVILTKQP